MVWACGPALPQGRPGRRCRTPAQVRDDGVVAQPERPAWVTAATTAAVRLAAEADADVDEILEHAGGAPLDRLAAPITRLEQSADATEVATDLAGLLWAECEDVPPIVTILEEPATQAALEAVAEARRRAARRLTAEAGVPEPDALPTAASERTLGIPSTAAEERACTVEHTFSALEPG